MMPAPMLAVVRPRGLDLLRAVRPQKQEARPQQQAQGQAVLQPLVRRGPLAQPRAALLLVHLVRQLALLLAMGNRAQPLGTERLAKSKPHGPRTGARPSARKTPRCWLACSDTNHPRRPCMR